MRKITELLSRRYIPSEEVKTSVPPILTEEEKAVQFTKQFSSIRQQLLDLGCRFDNTGARVGTTNVFREAIHLHLPRKHEKEVEDLLSKAEITLPDQSLWEQAQALALFSLAETGMIDQEYLETIAKEKRIVIFDGTGLQKEHFKQIFGS